MCFAACIPCRLPGTALCSCGHGVVSTVAGFLNSHLTGFAFVTFDSSDVVQRLIGNRPEFLRFKNKPVSFLQRQHFNVFFRYSLVTECSVPFPQPESSELIIEMRSILLSATRNDPVQESMIQHETLQDVLSSRPAP